LRKILSFPTVTGPRTTGPFNQVPTRTVSAEMIRHIVEGKVVLPYSQLFILPDIGLLNSDSLDLELVRSLISGKFNAKQDETDQKIEQLSKELQIKIEPFQDKLDLTVSQVSSLFQIPIFLLIPEKPELPDRDSPADFRIFKKDKFVSWTKMKDAFQMVRDGNTKGGLDKLQNIYTASIQNEASLTALLTHIYFMSLEPEKYSVNDRTNLLAEHFHIIHDPLLINFSRRLKGFKQLNSMQVKSIYSPQEISGTSIFDDATTLERYISKLYMTDPYIEGFPAEFFYERVINLDLDNFNRDISKLKSYYLMKGYLILDLLLSVMEKKGYFKHENSFDIQ